MSCTVETMPDMADDVWLSSLLRYGIHDLDDGDAVQSMAAALATRGPVVDSGGTATHELLGALNEVWERGWQPADVVHAARKDATAGSVSLAVALIGEDARRTDAASRAPEAWIDQLREMGALTSGDPAVVAGWHRAERRSPADAWRVVLLLARVLRTAVRIETLLPPPSRWGPPRSRPAGESPAGDERERVLRRIRGLLAKAESTEFPEEAEALTAKAQELMTRYAVDAAVLDTALLGTGVSSAGAVAARRVHVADPYVRAK